MAKKFNLADYVAAPVSTMDTMEITPIPIQLIDANWQNFYAVDSIEEDLAESIEVSGLLTPLGVLRKDGGRYKLISGHRRLRALKYLHDSRPGGREKYAAIPCVVYDSPMDADREELMLIHANAQRIKTGAELTKEAEKTTAILTRLKENGAELPGRMRDRVSEALKISSTRLARLDAIKNNLTYPGWVQKWKKSEITEAVAYRLSQLDYSQQMHAADWVIDHHIASKDLTVKHIEEALAHPPLTSPGCADPLAYEEDPVVVDRELVKRADFAGRIRLNGLAFANRKDAMDKLKAEYRWAGSHGGGISWDGDPKGIRFAEPVEWLLGWGSMYDALAANALDEAIAGATEQPRPALAKLRTQPEPPAPAEAPPADPMTAPTVAVSSNRWRSCRDDPPEGWTLATVLTPWTAPPNASYDIDLMSYRNGKWWGVYDACSDEMDVDNSWWMPASPPPTEVWE